MNEEILELSIADLLRMIQERKSGEFAYEAEQCLFKRWRQGIDIGYLIALLSSKKTRNRLLGSYYLGEVAEAVEKLRKPVIKLATDPIYDCRRAFVVFMVNSGFYDEKIGEGLVKCLSDMHLYVRQETIKWAVFTTDEHFDHFSRMVELDAGKEIQAFSRSESRACRQLRSSGDQIPKSDLM